MLFDDTYREITQKSIGLYKEKNSKFVSYAFHVNSEEEIKKHISNIKYIEKGASHYCYAYVLYNDRSNWKVNDDGEPRSTGGKPILGQINKHKLTNIIIIVVRYYGGIKLGITGLIRSYKSAALDAINNNQIISKKIQDQYEISFQYEHINKMISLVKNNKANIIEKKINTNDCKILFEVNRVQSEKIFNIFKKENKLEIKYLKTI